MPSSVGAAADGTTALLRFDGRVALVTGAGSGLGREYALLLAARGAKVVVNDVGGSVAGTGSDSTASADAVVEEIRALGGTAISSTASVAQAEGAQQMVHAALDTWGRLDILINNAGVLRQGPLEDMALDAVDQVIAVHLMGTLYCTRAALAAMRSQNYGRIVLTSSAVGLMGYPGQAAYAAAKSAMFGLMHAVRQDCAGTGIAINTVAPVADTPMSKGILRQEIATHLSPRLVAPMVAWLASEGCTDSGHVINAGGGYFCEVAQYKSRGVHFDPREDLTPDMVGAAFGRIADMAEAEPYRGTLSCIEPELRRLGEL